MDHYCNSANYGSKTNDINLIIQPSRKLWNAIIPIMNSITTRSIIHPYCNRIIQTLRSTPNNDNYKDLYLNFYTSYIQSLYDNKMYDEGIKGINKSFEVIEVVL